jgi:HlyD family secretion protein
LSAFSRRANEREINMNADNLAKPLPHLLGRSRLLGGLSDSPGRKSRERRRAIARVVRRALLALLVLGAGLAVVLALRPRPVPVDLVEVTQGSLVVQIDESGVTRVVDRYAVSAPVSGNVSRAPYEPGDTVRAGDVLGRIVPTLSALQDERSRAEASAQLSASLSALGQARAMTERATVAKEQAERELGRTRALVSSGSAAAQALEQAEFDTRMRAQEVSSAEFAAKVAAEQVRMARAALGLDGEPAKAGRHVDVLAPVSGRVLRVHQKSSAVVPAGAPLLEVGDPTALEVVVDVLTTDAVHIAAGTPVVISGWGGDGPLAGRARRVEPSGFTRPSALGIDEQRVNVVIALTDPYERWAALADGYRVEAQFVLWHGDSVTKVPQGAVFRYGDGWALFRVEKDHVRLTRVVLGHRGETDVEIVSGVAAGVVVVVHPGDRVKDGARVESR